MEESILPMNSICFYKCSLIDLVYLLNGIFLWCKYKELLYWIYFLFFCRGSDYGIISTDGVNTFFLWGNKGGLTLGFLFVCVRMCVHYIMCVLRHKSQTWGLAEAFAGGMVDTEEDENIGGRL